MAFNVHYRATANGISGTLANPTEIWSFGIAIGFPGAGPDALPGDLDLTTLGAVGAFFNSVFTQTELPTGSNHFYTSYKVAQIAPDGSYGAPAQEVVLGTPVQGSGTGTMPLQIASVVSLRGPNALPRIQGRFYLPASSSIVIVSSTGKIGGDGPADMALLVSGAIDTLNTALEAFSTGLRVVVASTKGSNAEVVAVRVGDVLDTQRRRRNALVETYTEVPV